MSYIFIRWRWRLCGAIEWSGRERVHGRGIGSRNCQWDLLLPKIWDLITPTRPHATLVTLWSRPTPTRCLPFIGHGSYPRDACPFLATPYIHAMLVSGIFLLILPSAGCICQQRFHRRSRWYITIGFFLMYQPSLLKNSNNM